jgi:hypothetical protein
MQQIVNVFRIRLHASRNLRNAAVSRRANHITHLRRTANRRTQGVLAPASSNHQHLHLLLIPTRAYRNGGSGTKPLKTAD